jgi:hypothetical protein
MIEILPGVFDYTVHNTDIKHDVHSTFVAGTDLTFLIDPMKPENEVAWFDGREPKHIYVTNRHHDRGIPWFVETFDCSVWCHESGLHEFEELDLNVLGFKHGQMLPGGVVALEVGVLCPEETAFLIPAGNGVLAIGDAIISYDGLGFVPDYLIGESPEDVKRGMVEKIRSHLDRDFDTLVMAHGAPIVAGAKESLSKFLDGTGY